AIKIITDKPAKTPMRNRKAHLIMLKRSRFLARLAKQPPVEMFYPAGTRAIYPVLLTNTIRWWARELGLSVRVYRDRLLEKAYWLTAPLSSRQPKSWIVRQQLRRFGRSKDFYPVLLAGRNRLGRIGLRVGCRGWRQFHASGRTRHRSFRSPSSVR